MEDVVKVLDHIMKCWTCERVFSLQEEDEVVVGVYGAAWCLILGKGNMSVGDRKMEGWLCFGRL